VKVSTENKGGEGGGSAEEGTEAITSRFDALGLVIKASELWRMLAHTRRFDLAAFDLKMTFTASWRGSQYNSNTSFMVVRELINEADEMLPKAC
jgi:hypothetical protein